MPRRRRKTLGQRLLPLLRVVGWTVAVCAVLLLIVVAVVEVGFDPNRLKPDLAAAVARATGRELTLRGPIELELGLPPTLAMSDFALANAAGGSRPEMVTVQRLQARVALLPLLIGRTEVNDLSLEHVDVLLETDAHGQGNWRLQSQAAPAEADQPAPAAASADQPTGPSRGTGRYSIRSLRIDDLHVAWRNGETGRTADWTVPRLRAEAEEVGRSMLVEGEASANGKPLRLRGEIGPLARLFDRSATLPWPVQLLARNDAVRLEMQGTVVPRANRGLGYDLRVSAAISDPTPLAGFLPLPTPDMHEATLSARISDSDGAMPAISNISFRASDLLVPSLLPDTLIQHVDFAAAGPELPIIGDVQVQYNDTPIHVSGSVSNFSALLSDALPKQSVAVELNGDAGGALLTLKGIARSLRPLTGVEMALQMRVASIRAMGPLFRTTLPNWISLAVDARLDGRFDRNGTLTLSRLTATLPQVDFAGTLKVTNGPRPSVTGSLTSRQFDLDDLLKGFSAPPTSPIELPGRRPQEETWRLQAPLPPPKPTSLIPDDPLNLGWLGYADVDVKWDAATVKAGSATYTNLTSRLLLRDSKLVVDPLTAQSGADTLGGRLAVDASVAEPRIETRLRFPALPLQTVATMLQQAASANGVLFFDADLRGSGRTPHAIAAALDGKIGVAVSDGEVDNALVGGLAADVLKTAKLPDNVISLIGKTRLHCLAARMEFAHGRATLAPFVADTAKLLLEGRGSIDLGPETLALRLRPTLRTGPGIVVPVDLAGTLLEPKWSLADLPVPAAGGKLAGVLSAVVGAAAASPAADPCPAALVAVRGEPAPAAVPAAPPPGAAPAAAAPTASAAPPAPPAKPAPPPGKLPKPADVLRSLLN